MGVFFSSSSPAIPAAISEGIAELRRLGFVVDEPAPLPQEGYFAGGHKERLRQFQKPFPEKSLRGVVATRRGYGADYLMDLQLTTIIPRPKSLVRLSAPNIIQLLRLATPHPAGI